MNDSKREGESRYRWIPFHFFRPEISPHVLDEALNELTQQFDTLSRSVHENIEANTSNLIETIKKWEGQDALAHKSVESILQQSVQFLYEVCLKYDEFSQSRLALVRLWQALDQVCNTTDLPRVRQALEAISPRQDTGKKKGSDYTSRLKQALTRGKGRELTQEEKLKRELLKARAQDQVEAITTGQVAIINDYLVWVAIPFCQSDRLVDAAHLYDALRAIVTGGSQGKEYEFIPSLVSDMIDEFLLNPEIIRDKWYRDTFYRMIHEVYGHNKMLPESPNVDQDQELYYGAPLRGIVSEVTLRKLYEASQFRSF